MRVPRFEGGESICPEQPKRLPQLPVEVFHHCCTFADTNTLEAVELGNKDLQKIVNDDDLWEQLIVRDFHRKQPPEDTEDRTRKDVYFMMKSGKFLEKRFEERPTWQRILILVGCIVLSPLLLIYLSPQIARGIYKNCIEPAATTWSDMSDSVSPLPTKRYSSSTWVGAKRRKYRKTFSERPLWQRTLIVIISFLGSPYLLVRHWRVTKAAFGRFLGWSWNTWCLPTGRFVQQRIWKPFKSALLYLKSEGNAALKWLHDYLEWKREHSWIRNVFMPETKRRTVQLATLIRNSVVKMKNTFVAIVKTCYNALQTYIYSPAKNSVIYIRNQVKSLVKYLAARAHAAAHWCAQRAKEGAIWIQSHVVRPTVRFLQWCDNKRRAFCEMVMATVLYFASKTKALAVSLAQKARAFAEMAWHHLIVRPAVFSHAQLTRLAIAVGNFARKVYQAAEKYVLRPIWKGLCCAGNQCVQFYDAVVLKLKQWRNAFANAVLKCCLWLRNNVVIPICRAIVNAVLYPIRLLRRGISWFFIQLVPCALVRLLALYDALRDPIVKFVLLVCRGFKIVARVAWDKAMRPLLFTMKTVVLLPVAIVAYTYFYLTKRVFPWIYYNLLRPMGLGIKTAAKAVYAGVVATLNAVLNCIAAIAVALSTAFLAVVGAIRLLGIKVLRAFMICARTLYEKILVPVGKTIKMVFLALRAAVYASIRASKAALITLVQSAKALLIALSKFVSFYVIQPVVYLCQAVKISVIAPCIRAINTLVRTIVTVVTAAVNYAKDDVVVPAVRAMVSAMRSILKTVVSALRYLAQAIGQTLRGVQKVVSSALRAIFTEVKRTALATKREVASLIRTQKEIIMAALLAMKEEGTRLAKKLKGAK